MATDAIVGKSIGSYYIEEIIARDDTGSIYKGRHSVFAGRTPVAIKVLAEHISAKIDYDQFMHETQELIQLKHQNILSIIEVGKDGNNFYIVNPYEPLASLEERIRSQEQRPMPLEEAQTILDQIGRALRYAHEAGIIHRNLKPANILFTTPDTILVADFGLAVVANSMQATTDEPVHLDAQKAPPADPANLNTISKIDEQESTRTDEEIELYESFLFDVDSTNPPGAEQEQVTDGDPVEEQAKQVDKKNALNGTPEDKLDSNSVLKVYETDTSVKAEEDFSAELEIFANTDQILASHTGTYAYLAPEQFNGKARKKSDQYALACIAYELFTGHRPFDIPTDADRAAWMQVHQHETPTPPTHYNAALPDYIEKAVLKALLKDRRARYADIISFIRALHNIVLSDPVKKSTKRRSRLIAFVKNRLNKDESAQYPDGKIPWGLRIVAALCYLTIGIGGIFILLSKRGQHRFLRFHAWQATLYCLVLILEWIISRIIPTRPSAAQNLTVLAGIILIFLLVFGIILAIEKTLKGLYYKAPILGWIAERLTNI